MTVNGYDYSTYCTNVVLSFNKLIGTVIVFMSSTSPLLQTILMFQKYCFDPPVSILSCEVISCLHCNIKFNKLT